MRKKLIFAFAVAVLAPAAGATTLARMTLSRLAAAATAIVRARCQGNASRWEGGEIWTLTSFRTLETLKGTLPANFTVRLIGGEVGGIESIVSEVPRFQAGEQVILFLEPTKGGDYAVTGWVEGTFRVRRDAAGRQVVMQESARQLVYDQATRKFHVEADRTIPLDAFRLRIRSLVSAARATTPSPPSPPGRKPQ